MNKTHHSPLTTHYSSKPLVSIIVLQFNHSEQTLACLESLCAITYNNYDVIVVDNNSDIEHLKNIEYWIASNKNSSLFTLYSLLNNTGYAGGNNIGIIKALEKESHYVLILNNDTKVKPDFLNHMVETAQSDEKIGIVQSVIDEYRGLSSVFNPRLKIYGGGPVGWFTPNWLHDSNEPENGIIPNTHYAIGACMLIKKEVFENIGMLDDKYFLYFDDLEFSLRARTYGYIIALAKNSLVSHIVSASTSSLGDGCKMYYCYRNMFDVTKKYGPWYKFVLPIWIRYTDYKQQIKLLFNRQPKLSKYIRKAIADYRSNRFGQIDETI